MILYNVTVKVDDDIHEEWLRWMREQHIPDVMSCDIFQEYKLLKIMEQPEADGHTYAIQYFCESMAAYEQYQREFAPALQAEHTEKFKDKFVAFRTIMEVVT